MEKVALLDKKDVAKRVKKQIELASKESNNVLINSFIDYVEGKYNVIKKSPNEIYIKIDRKKNMGSVKQDINANIASIMKGSEVDPSFIFKILTYNNEIIIRIKR